MATRPSTSVRSSSLLPEPVAPMHRPCGPAALGGLLEVERDRRAAVVHPDRHAQPVRRRRRSTRSASTASAVTVPGAPARGRAARAGPRPAPDRPEGRHRRAGTGRAGGPTPWPRRPEGIRPADGTDAAGPVVQAELARPDEQAHHGGRRPPAGWRPHPQHRRRPRPRPTSRARPRRRRPRAGAGRRSGARGPARELGLPPLPDVVGPSRDHPHRPDGVAEPRMPSVRQPLDPLPLRRQVRGGDHGEQRVRGAVPQHVLRDERPRQCAGVLGPAPGAASSQIAAVPCSDSATGSSGTTACARRKRRRASAVTGSSPSTGPVCGATSAVAGRCAPVPARSRPKSGSELRRSHSRPAASTVGQAAGSGCTCSRAARCSATTPGPAGGSTPGTAGSRAAPRPRPPAADLRFAPRLRRAASRPSTREHAAEQQRRRIRADPARRTRPSPAASPRAAAGRGARPGRAARAGWRFHRELAAGHPRDGARRPRTRPWHRASVPAVRARYTALPATSAKRPRGGPQRGDSRQPHRQFVAVPQNRRRPRVTPAQEVPCAPRPPTAG